MLLRDLYSENAPQIDIQSGDHIFVEDRAANIVTTSSVVDHEGNVVFVGKVKAAGRSINELKIEIEALMHKFSEDAFQIQIENFSSQTA